MKWLRLSHVFFSIEQIVASAILVAVNFIILLITDRWVCDLLALLVNVRLSHIYCGIVDVFRVAAVADEHSRPRFDGLQLWRYQHRLLQWRRQTTLWCMYRPIIHLIPWFPNFSNLWAPRPWPTCTVGPLVYFDGGGIQPCAVCIVLWFIKILYACLHFMTFYPF